MDGIQSILWLAHENMLVIHEIRYVHISALNPLHWPVGAKGCPSGLVLIPLGVIIVIPAVIIVILGVIILGVPLGVGRHLLGPLHEIQGLGSRFRDSLRLTFQHAPQCPIVSLTSMVHIPPW